MPRRLYALPTTLIALLGILQAAGPSAAFAGRSPTRQARVVARELGIPSPRSMTVDRSYSRTLQLSTMGADANLTSDFGPIQSSGDDTQAAGCGWYYFYLPNDKAAPLTVDFIRLDDPAGFPGGPYVFAQNLVIPAFSVVAGYVQVGFCATRIEVQYNYDNSVSNANQRFFHNIALFSFGWRWIKIGALAPPVAIAYFNTSTLFPPPNLASESSSGSGPMPCQGYWVNDASCSSGFSSWTTTPGGLVSTANAPGLSPAGIGALGLMLIGIGSFAIRRKLAAEG